jgi:two-component system response regulator NreC
VVEVVFVDSHPVLRLGLRTLVSRARELKVVGECGDWRRAHALVKARRPSILVSGIGLPDRDGIAAIPQMLRVAPELRILIFTSRPTDGGLTRALSLGAAGYALKSQSTREVLAAIRTVAAGKKYFPPMRDPSTAEAGAPSLLQALSPREREVFDFIMRGASSVAIARALSLSLKTVETHRAHINQKLGTRSTVDLLRLGAREGLLGPGQPKP